MTKTQIISTAAAMSASLLLAACGTTTNPASNGGTPVAASDAIGTPPKGSVDAAIGDCTPSFRYQMKDFITDEVSVAVDAAKRKHRFIATCFDGSPLRDIRWDPNVNFGEQDAGVDDTTLGEINQARALGLRPQLERIIHTPRFTGGSGQLELLELLANTQGLGRAYLFTDAIVNQVDGIDLTTASPKEIQRVIHRWVPRMGDGLRHVLIAFVGVGRRTPNTAEVRRAEVLLRGIVHGAGGTSIWAQALPQLSS